MHHPVKMTLLASVFKLFILTNLLMFQSPVSGEPHYHDGTTGYQTSGVSAVSNAHVMVQAWSSLTSTFSQCQKTFEQSASLEEAVKVATTLSTQVQWVSQSHGKCDCYAPDRSEINAQFKTMVIQFFSSMQAVLQLGQQRYFSVWEVRFKPIFKSCSLAVTSLKSISESLRLKLVTIIQQLHLNFSIFSSVGIDLSALLSVSVQLWGHDQGGGKGLAQGLGLGLGVSNHQGQGSGVGSVGLVVQSHEIEVIVQGWSSLSSAFTECSKAFEQHVSVDLAIQAITRLTYHIESVNSRYGKCACHQISASSITATFRSQVVQFFTALQHILELGQRYYSNVWLFRFKPIIEKALPAISSLKNICSSLRIDFGLLLQQVHVNVNLFTQVGLYVSTSSTLNVAATVGHVSTGPSHQSSAGHASVSTVQSPPSTSHPSTDQAVTSPTGSASINHSVGGHASVAPNPSGAANVNTSPSVNHSLDVHAGSQKFDAIVRGWASLTPAFSRCQTVFNHHASVEVALQESITLSNQIQQISQQYGRCISCNSASATQENAQFKQVVSNFFISMQSILRLGQQQYMQEWESRFKPVFQRCNSAFISLKTICTSLEIDLSVILNQVQIDQNLFLRSGLSLDVVLNENLSNPHGFFNNF